MNNKFGQSYYKDTLGLAKELSSKEADTDAKIYALTIIVKRLIVVAIVLVTLIGFFLLGW
jgi:hypothetical protein